MADERQTSRLRPAHVLASSLAAVTGAFLASRLGVYGTVIGVGVISLFSTLGTDIYIRSLDRTRQLAAKSKVRPIRLPRTNRAAETAELPSVADAAEVPRTADAPADDQPTGVLPDVPADARQVDRDEAATLALNPAPAERHVDSGEQESASDRDYNQSRWTLGRVSLVVAGAVASFVLAFVVITGIETVSGSSLSGGGRTTFGELAVDDPTDPGTDSEEGDAPGQPAPTSEPTDPTPTSTDPPDNGEQGVPVPPADDAPDAETPADPETPSPSPTEPPTPEPTDPPVEGNEGSSTNSTDPQP